MSEQLSIFDQRFRVVKHHDHATQIFERATTVNGVDRALTLIVSGDFAPDVHEVLTRLCDELAQVKQVNLLLKDKIARLERERAEGWTDLKSSDESGRSVKVIRAESESAS